MLTRDRCACTFAPAPGCAWKRPRACATKWKQYLRQQIPKDELNTILDNIGLPYSGINLSYATSGVIGTSDAEILVGLDQEHHHPTQDYIRRLRANCRASSPVWSSSFSPLTS